MAGRLAALLLLVAFAFAAVSAQEAMPDTTGPPLPAAPTNVTVADKPDDAGHGVIVGWDLSADDGAGLDNVLAYEVYRSDAADGEYVKRGVAVKGASEYEDEDKTPTENGAPNPGFIATGVTYYYKVRAMAPGPTFSEYSEPGPGQAVENWFHFGKIPILFGVIIFWGIVVYFIFKARGG